jgi:uncharacterized Ntn-hydrolase superfamily protein
LVVRDGAGFGGGNDRWIDLRVDHHHDPLGELGRLLDLQHLYYDQPDPATLQPVDEATAAEIRAILESLGGGPGGRFERLYVPMSGTAPADDPSRSFVGEPRQFPPNWDGDWQRALDAWLDAENLEARTAAPGWIDPRVLTILRTRRPA